MYSTPRQSLIPLTDDPEWWTRDRAYVRFDRSWRRQPRRAQSAPGGPHPAPSTASPATLTAAGAPTTLADRMRSGIAGTFELTDPELTQN